MSRFANLEFDDSRRAPTEGGPKGAPVRDAWFFHRKGDALYLNGDFDAALQNFSRALEQNSAFFEGWFGQVRMLIEMSEYDEALMWADKALELFPDQPTLFAAKAVAFCRAGAMDKAMANSDMAVSKKGLTPYVWLSRAEVLFARRSATAEHCLANAINVAGNDVARVRLEAGRLLLRVRHGPAAMEHLARAVTDLPKAALAWLELGLCQTALSLPAAEISLTQCLRLRPGWDRARRALDRYRSRGLLSRMAGFFRRLFGR